MIVSMLVSAQIPKHKLRPKCNPTLSVVLYNHPIHHTTAYVCSHFVYAAEILITVSGLWYWDKSGGYGVAQGS